MIKIGQCVIVKYQTVCFMNVVEGQDNIILRLSIINGFLKTHDIYINVIEKHMPKQMTRAKISSTKF